MGQPSPKPDSDPVLEEYSLLAPSYDTRWSSYITATTRATMARMALQPTDRILDVGCGTGALLDPLCRRYPQARLVGIDPVPEMLAIARQRLPATVDLRLGRAEQLPCAAASFDVVASCNMFHYLRQPLLALRELRRVLRPGGRLIITDWCDDYLACRVCDWYLRRFSPAHYKTYGTRDCQRLLKAAGFLDTTTERYKISWFWGLMTAQATRDNRHD